PRLAGARGDPDVGVVDGDVAPAEKRQTRSEHRILDESGDLLRLSIVGRKKHQTDAVLARRRQVEIHPAALTGQELVRHLNQNAGAVSGFRVRPLRAAVAQVEQNVQRLADDAVRPTPLDVDDEPYA